jgi:hypothetical protein
MLSPFKIPLAGLRRVAKLKVRELFGELFEVG